MLLQAGRQQMENKLVQELWGWWWCCRRWRAGTDKQQNAECLCSQLRAVPGVAGQADGSWGMCQGLAGSERLVSPALCLSPLSHQRGALVLPPSCPFPFRLQGGNVWKHPEPFWGCFKGEITLASPVWALQRKKLRHRELGSCGNFWRRLWVL